MDKKTSYRRIIRARRVMTHAAELLEQEAKALLECHTVDGDWHDEAAAKAVHNDMLKTARELRALVTQ